MASISSVITGGFGTPGSAALVITDGYGIGEASTLVGRSRRRRRRWESEIARADAPTAPLIKKERALVEQMLVAAEIDDLIDERKILRAAIDQATKRQAKQLEEMVTRISRRVDDIVEDDDITLMLL